MNPSKHSNHSTHTNPSKTLGQYFTTSTILKTKVLGFIHNQKHNHTRTQTSHMLEPSVGRGDLVVAVKERYPLAQIDMFEIDPNLDFIVDKTKIVFGDFLSQKITKKYTTIFGNPPYVKQSKTSNLYLQFIDRCVELLEENGELIFIVPSTFFNLTSSKRILEKMFENGRFTHIFHPDCENLFEGASIDVVVFRYVLGNLPSNPISDPLPPACTETEAYSIIYNDKTRFINYSDGVVTFSDKRKTATVVGDLFNVYVGIVSGMDKVFKNPIGNLPVLTDEGTCEKFILAKTFPTGNEEIDAVLTDNKEALMSRRIRRFSERNWYEWGALRNFQTMETLQGMQCIYVLNLTRQKRIAFIDKVQYFGGKLLMIVPKPQENEGRLTAQTQTHNLQALCNYLNSEEFMEKHTLSGRFKIGQRELLHVDIPDLG